MPIQYWSDGVDAGSTLNLNGSAVRAPVINVVLLAPGDEGAMDSTSVFFLPLLLPITL